MPWGLLAVSLPGIAVLLSWLQVGDLAYQIVVGRRILDTGSIPRTDFLTYTIQGAPWIDQQWGAQVILALLHAPWGFKGLMLVQAAIVSVSFGATYVAVRRAGAAPVVASVLCLGGFVATAALPGALAMRPQLLALPLVVIAAWLIRDRTEYPRRLLILPFIAIVWANLHGSFVVLIALLGIAFAADLVGRRPTRSWTGSLFVVSLITPLATPWGVDTYRYVIDVSTTPIVRGAGEWAPLYTRVPAGPILLLLVVALVLCVRLRGTRRPTFEEAATFVAFTGLAVWSGRNVLWWSVIVPPIAAGPLAGWRPGGVWSRTSRRVIAGGLAAAVALAVTRVAAAPTPSLLREAPAGVAAAVAALPPEHGRVFAEWYGGWLEYAVPGEPMFVDARLEAFPQEIWDDYARVVELHQDWEQVLDRWGVDTVVVATDHHPALHAALQTSGIWVVAHRDDEGVVYVRATPLGNDGL